MLNNELNEELHKAIEVAKEKIHNEDESYEHKLAMELGFILGLEAMLDYFTNRIMEIIEENK